ncbi:Crp/Fnr family transcriptional regulator [Aestuariivirga sp.]|uniref:Crp/Fnr family transcriptional regulator n=1 Tax=Aestuariivirga sp. TaxID=2650926 RepID=UPI00391C7B4A
MLQNTRPRVTQTVRTGRTGRTAPPPVPRPILRSLLTAARPLDLKVREVLFHAGDAGEGCYYLREGVVKAAVVAKDGQERLLAVLGPGSLIGELSLIDDAPRSATISALKPCRLLHLSKSSFFRLADANPQVYREALKILARRLRETNESMVAQGTVTVAGRVARAFASLAEGLGEPRPGGRVLLPNKITQTDIAGMAGVARENASRAINDLLRDGILGREGSFYVIVQPDELRDMAEI